LETADWLLAEMRTPEGGFASALDADSEGEEGKFYVWTPDELRAVLGDEDGAWACRVFGVTDEGTFERGTSVLRLLADPLAPRPGSGDPEAPADPDEAARFARVRAALREARAARVRPGRDDKVVAAWNGLTIAALAEAGVILDRPDLLDADRAAPGLPD